MLGYVDSWEEDETLFIQTELCDLGNFGHFLWEYGRVFPRLDEARVWKVMAELSAGLRFIHDASVIHLDLKPANIFVTGEGRLKIGDFGMASVWPRPAPNAEGVLPTPQQTKKAGFEREGDKLYLAPEVLQGRYGKAADVFSLGLTMLETAANIVVPDQYVPVLSQPFYQTHFVTEGKVGTVYAARISAKLDSTQVLNCGTCSRA